MPGPGGDVVIMRFVIPESLVNIAHIPRFLWRWLTPQTERLRVLDIGSISGSRFHAEIAMPLSEYTMNIFTSSASSSSFSSSQASSGCMLERKIWPGVGTVGDGASNFRFGSFAPIPGYRDVSGWRAISDMAGYC
jgi:hypothetical protein